MKTTAIVAVALGALVTNAAAGGPGPEPTSTGKTVHISGCPAPGVEAGNCLTLTSRGTTYDISAATAQANPANPADPPAKPRVGYLGITVDGTVDPSTVSTCQQGTILKDIKWTYTRSKCDNPKPGAKPAASGASSAPLCKWQANHDFMPPQPARLSVTGTCQMPTPGYKLSLEKATPQGINPAILLLNLKIQKPGGIVSEVITATPVSPYEEKTATHYKSVTILPGGDNIPVRETQ